MRYLHSRITHEDFCFHRLFYTYVDLSTRKVHLVGLMVFLSLFPIQTILSEKPELPDFSKVADVLGVSPGELESEWRILRRLEGDLSAQDNLIILPTSPEKCAMFPAFSSAIYKLLPLPVGTATVECSFSATNRILNSERCCLLPGHTCQLMQLAVEGPRVPDVRDAEEEEVAHFVTSTSLLTWRTECGWPSHVGGCSDSSQKRAWLACFYDFWNCGTTYEQCWVLTCHIKVYV